MVGAVVVALLVVGVLQLIIFSIIIAASSSKENTPLADKSVLHLTLDKEIVDIAQDNPFENLDFGPFAGGGKTSLRSVKNAIAEAAKNEKVKGIFLDCGSVATGMANVEEIRNSLIEFKASGKWIVAYADYYSEGAYYLASVADEIHVNPGGIIEINGLATTIPFIKGTLAKLEVEPQIFRVGDFKSAIEPFILDKMSDSNRVQTTKFLGSMNDHMIKNIASSRKLKEEDVREVSNEMLIRNANDAVKYGLATNVSYYDHVEASIRKRLELKEDDKIKFASAGKVLGATEEDEKEVENKVAIIYAEGEIGGKNSKDGIGSEDLSKQIRKARDDKKVKAIVLRVNSPGGSALTSDIIWREMVLAKAKKPVIACMGNVAASGGYYIAMCADTIVAQPNTITGSIGVFGLLFNAKGLLNNKIGVTADGVKTGKYSDLGEPSRPLTEGEKFYIQKSVEMIYDTFTTKAALGRNMPVETLKRYASGRVWSGIDAKERGLVDVLGGIDDAVKIAATKAGLKEGEYKIKNYPEKKSFIDELLSSLNDDAEARIMKAYLGDMYNEVQSVKKMQQYNGVIQARLPYDIIVK